MGGLTMVDLGVLGILALAVVRGLLRGLIRETFSVAALAGACLAVLYGAAPLGERLDQLLDGRIGPLFAPWIAGLLITVGTLSVVMWIGKITKRTARFVGLGWADRVGGGTLGAAEGVLAVALAVTAAVWLLGREHPMIAQSRSVAAVEELRDQLAAVEDQLPDVASPPEVLRQAR